MFVWHQKLSRIFYIKYLFSFISESTSKMLIKTAPRRNTHAEIFSHTFKNCALCGMGLVITESVERRRDFPNAKSRNKNIYVTWPYVTFGRKTKMAAGPRWGSLPSVLIVDILSYLSHEDRLKASSVNKRWRNCLFHPSLWSKIKFQLGFSKRHRSRFLADRCGRFVREAVIKFNAHNCLEVREGMRIITILRSNKNLQHFALFPSSCHIEWPDSNFVNR